MADPIERPEKLTMELLSAVAATGVGSPFGLRGPAKDFTIQAVDTGLTSGTLDLEGSLDGLTWFELASHAFTTAEIAADGAMYHVTDRGVNFIRANLTAYVGTALTVKAIALPTHKER